ncbi:MAG: hypothetical protein KDA24_29860 [Deltaproteobacteria bacterium]|nr:hypothetical protein [Deltaproteobacteria bacterium]
MGFFNDFFHSPARGARRIVESLAMGSGDFSGLEGLSLQKQLDTLDRAVRDLVWDERFDAAEQVFTFAASLTPLALLERRLDFYRVQERIDDEVATLRTAVKAHPRNPEPRARLARLLGDLDRATEALALLQAAPAEDALLDLERCAVLIDLGRGDEALPELEEMVPQLEGALRGAFDDNYRILRERLMRANALLDDVHVTREGGQARVLSAASRGQIDRHAAINYTLIGQGLMARSGAQPVSLRVQPLDEDGTALALDNARGDLIARTRHGLSELRLGHPSRAKLLFSRAHEADASYFPAALGLGAAMRMEETHAIRRIDDLPALHSITGLERLLPDWAALTELERRVVHASALPLRCALPALSKARAQLIVLPLDVRPSDRRELSEVGESDEPHAVATDALAGFAMPHLAVVRLEDLLDTTSPNMSWVFAHELAHMAMWRLPERTQQSIERLHQRALDNPWAVGGYQQKNPQEFFAVGYEGWLRTKYRRHGAPVRDEAGIVDELFALFDRIDAADSFSGL